MSGEYYCIDEVCDAVNYYDECQSKNRGASNEVANFYRDNDSFSNSSKRNHDLRLHEIEDQLEIAENRCNTLKGQLDSMKKIYNKGGKVEPSRPIKKSETSFIANTSPSENTHISRTIRKRSCSPHSEHDRNPTYTTSRKRSQYETCNTSTLNISQKSSDNSTGDDPGESFYVPPLRQATNCISTDDSGAAVKTINTILSGITDSFNKYSTIQQNREGRITMTKTQNRSQSNDAGVVYDASEQPFSPRVKKRLNEQQKKVDEIVKCRDIPDLDKWTTNNESVSNVKTRSLSTAPSDRNSNAKKSKVKGKMHSSSDSINSKKHIKSTAKHVENTTKMRPTRTGMVDGESQMVVLSKKRKRPVKRLKQISKISLSRKHSDNETRKRFEQFTTDNLVELYHNVAAKESDSDESNSGAKSQANRQKGAGDLPSTPVRITGITTPFNQNAKDTINNKDVMLRSFSKMEPAAVRTLSPIEEHRTPERALTHPELYNGNMTRNYALPTISSALKKARKCYLQSFNFRAIPFCAAKSTSPSHNIGINIQQVMSIIKSRRSVTGISPTLAHNITLAAGRLSTHPVKAFVSTLSSRIGYGRSVCPLNKYPVNYSQLQELAKEIPEEPEDEQCQFPLEQETEFMMNSKTPETMMHSMTPETTVNGPSGDKQETPTPPVWKVDTSNEDRCTCIPQKGISFQQVLSKYQMHPEATYSDKTSSFGERNVSYAAKNIIYEGRNPFYANRNLTTCAEKTAQLIMGRVARTQKLTRAALYTSPKQRLAWSKNDTTNYYNVDKKKSEKALEGKEKNLKFVLKNLHDDFDALNTKYETLALQVSSNEVETNEQTVKELEEMETALNKKEEEINMVMALYTEVMALKEQVKKLRERTSQASVALLQPTRSKISEPNAALHLTQLLRQIQNYQEVCRNKQF